MEVVGTFLKYDISSSIRRDREKIHIPASKNTTAAIKIWIQTYIKLVLFPITAPLALVKLWRVKCNLI